MRRMAAALAVVLAAGGGLGRPAVAASTLYDTLGAQPGLTRIVDRMFVFILADDRIKAKFDDINIPRLKLKLVEQFCQVSGGPCRRTGPSMRGAHKGLDLHDGHFNALVEDLQNAMDEEGIPFRTQNRLLALLAPMERDVVTR